GTSAGTSAGAATLYATVPHAPTNPSNPRSGSVSQPSCTSARAAASASARSASAEAMNRRREMRSASTPAGIDSTRNGSVCAVCKRPVSPAPAPSAITATMGAAARAICSADCAARFDHASRLKPAGSGIRSTMPATYERTRTPRTPHLAAEFQRRWRERRADDLPNVENLPQAVADQIDGEHRQREEETGKQDDPERELYVRLALGHDVAPRWNVRRRAGAEEGQVGLEQDGRRTDVGGLHDERGHQRGQHVTHQNA